MRLAAKRPITVAAAAASAAVVARGDTVADDGLRVGASTEGAEGGQGDKPADPLSSPTFGDWPMRQVCTNHGQVAWLSIASQLWAVLEGINVRGALYMDNANRVTSSVFEANRRLRWGHKTDQICWIGVISLQFWVLQLTYPETTPATMQAEWKLLKGADWAYLLLTDFPVFGLLFMNCCAFFASVHSRFELPCPECRCDELDDVEDPRAEGFLHFTDALVNTVLMEEDPSASVPDAFIDAPRPTCPIGHATWMLAQTLVMLVHSSGQSAWDQLAGAVRFAQRLVLDWVEPLDDPFSEIFGSRWIVFGLLHALHLQLRRKVDGHAKLPVPWLLPGGVAVRHLLQDSTSARGTFVRYFLANLRTEFWGAANGGAEGVARRLLDKTQGDADAPLDVVDVGASCTKEDCLILELLRIYGCGGTQTFRSTRKPSLRIFGLEPNAKNLRRSQARVKAALPRRWRLRCAHLHRVAASNITLATGAQLFGVGGGASLKSAAYAGKAYTAHGGGVVGVRKDEHVETVPVMRLADWVKTRHPRVHDIAFLKVDVEGMEWEVLQGVEPMLSEQRVGIIMLEYSHFWKAGVGSVGTGPTLLAVAEYMTTRGFDGYYVGSNHMLPLSGPAMEWWDPLYEVCEDPDKIIYRGIAGWCWFDVIFTLRGSAAAESASRWVPWSLVPGTTALTGAGRSGDNNSCLTKGEKARRDAWLKDRMRRRGLQ